jgi:hypothetical protein
LWIDVSPWLFSWWILLWFGELQGNFWYVKIIALNPKITYRSILIFDFNFFGVSRPFFASFQYGTIHFLDPFQDWAGFETLLRKLFGKGPGTSFINLKRIVKNYNKCKNWRGLQPLNVFYNYFLYSTLVLLNRFLMGDSNWFVKVYNKT